MSIRRLNNKFKLYKMLLREDIKINIVVYGRFVGLKYKWVFEYCFQEKFFKLVGISCLIFIKRFLNDQYKDLKRQEILV